ncbi:MAG: hypothetical protein D6813_10635, partial [Calditrichaeota bacterium]
MKYLIYFSSCLIFLLKNGFLLAGNLSGVTATPDDSEAGANTIYTISFTTSASGTGLPANGKIIITFPAQFDASGVVLASFSPANGGFSSVNGSGNVVTLVRDGSGTAFGPSSSVTVQIANVTNSKTTGSSFTVTVETQDNGGTNIDGPTGSANFSIIPAALGSFTITGEPGSVTAGVAFTNGITVTAKDIFGNTKTNYLGTVSWSSSDGQASLPLDYTFQGTDNGSHTFAGSGFVLKTAGGQTIT